MSIHNKHRRQFIKSTGVAGAGTLLLPNFLSALSGCADLSKVTLDGRRLVVIQLSGGNDGLNTLIPTGNDIYHRSRPNLAVADNKTLKITDQYGFNPSVDVFRWLYDEGLLSVVNGVGYPNPNRSHFRSMDIWQSAGDGNTELASGWVGRYLDAVCKDDSDPYKALQVGIKLDMALRGELRTGFSVVDPSQHDAIPSIMRDQRIDFAYGLPAQNPALHYLYKSVQSIQSSTDYLHEISKTADSKTSYPSTPFSRKLKTVSELISSGVDTSIYYVSHEGFDSHANQNHFLNWPLKVFNEGLTAFTKDLRSSGALDSTLVLVFSEFGRRVEENASGGTDHGTANCVFLIGNQLNRAGIYNDIPDLSDLDNGDLKYSIDFRQVYATILDKWLKVDSEVVLKQKFENLQFI
ncbi:MAG: DUF1501 domain-containing protein [Cyclobacteriaceae bacterium]